MRALLEKAKMRSMLLIVAALSLSACNSPIIHNAEFTGQPIVQQAPLDGSVGVMVNRAAATQSFQYPTARPYTINMGDFTKDVGKSTLSAAFKDVRSVNDPADAPLVFEFEVERPGYRLNGDILNIFEVTMKTTAFVDGEEVASRTRTTEPFVFSNAWGTVDSYIETANTSMTNSAVFATASNLTDLMQTQKVRMAIESSNNPELVDRSYRNLYHLASSHVVRQQALAQTAASANQLYQGLATFGANLGGAATQAYAAQNAPRPVSSSSGAGDPRAQCDGPTKQQLSQQWQAGCAQNANNMGCNDLRRLMRACGM